MARKRKRIKFWKWGFYINFTGTKFHINKMPKKKTKKGEGIGGSNA